MIVILHYLGDDSLAGEGEGLAELRVVAAGGVAEFVGAGGGGDEVGPELCEDRRRRGSTDPIRRRLQRLRARHSGNRTRLAAS